MSSFMGKYCSNCLADRIGGRSGKKSLAVYTTDLFSVLTIFSQEWWWIAGLSRAGAIAEAQMQYTPENERLEPKDDGLEEEFPFQQWRCLMIFGVHASFPGILLVKVGSWLSEESQIRKKILGIDLNNVKKQPQHQVHPINDQSEKSKETSNQISWGNNFCVSGSNSCYHVMHASDTWSSSHFRLDAALIIDILTGWIVVKIDWLVAGS